MTEASCCVVTMKLFAWARRSGATRRGTAAWRLGIINALTVAISVTVASSAATTTGRGAPNASAAIIGSVNAADSVSQATSTARGEKRLDHAVSQGPSNTGGTRPSAR